MLALLLCVGLLGCVGTPPQPEPVPWLLIDGSLTYRESVQLPEQARLEVSMRADLAQAPPLLRLEQPLAGSQVPLPFTLRLDRRRLLAGQAYIVEARIHVPHGPQWVVPPQRVLPVAGEGLIDLGRLAAVRLVPPAPPEVYQCGEHTLALVDQGALLEAHLPQGDFLLLPEPAADGAGYRASDDDSTVLTRLGDAAQVRVADVPLPPCRRVQPAVFFRARGHAPEWLLEIRQGELTLLAGQGLASRSWFLDAVGGDAQRRVYSAGLDGDPVRVVVRRAACEDPHNGRPWPYAVEVEYRAQRLAGCGGPATFPEPRPAALRLGGAP